MCFTGPCRLGCWPQLVKHSCILVPREEVGHLATGQDVVDIFQENLVLDLQQIEEQERNISEFAMLKVLLPACAACRLARAQTTVVCDVMLHLAPIALCCGKVHLGSQSTPPPINIPPPSTHTHTNYTLAEHTVYWALHCLPGLTCASSNRNMVGLPATPACLYRPLRSSLNSARR